MRMHPTITPRAVAAHIAIAIVGRECDGRRRGVCRRQHRNT